MMAVMRRLVELEKEFCRATAEEVCLTRLAEKMKRELEALRFEAATQAGAREREQQQLHLQRGFPVSAGLGCESIAGHFICADCALRQYRRQSRWSDTERKDAASAQDASGCGGAAAV